MAREREGSLTQHSVTARQSGLFNEDYRRSRIVRASIASIPGQEAEMPGKHKSPKVLYENTYKLEPERKFKASEAQAIIREELEAQLKEESYDPKASGQMAKTLAEIIKNRVKELNYERYKIACIVTIGQLAEQGMMMASRCCWDSTKDTFATGNFKNKTLYAVATVYAAYLE